MTVTAKAKNLLADFKKYWKTPPKGRYMSFKEIADTTGVSINTALGRMRYAILNMRRLAEEHNIVLTL